MKLAVPHLVAFMLVTLLLQPARAQSQAKTLLSAAKATSDENAREKAYERITPESIKDDSDLKAIYEEFSSLETTFAGDKNSQRRQRVMTRLRDVLQSATDQRFHKSISSLLESESKSLPPGGAGPWGARSGEEFAKESAKYERVAAVIEAAGKGKNESALPYLREMRKKGGVVGKNAETAIGRIGRDEDLSTFIAEIRADPKSQVSLYGFGRKGFLRLAKDLNDPAVPAAEKVRMAGALPNTVSSEDLPAAIALLKHPERRVVAVVSRTVANSLKASDAAVLEELLRNKDQAIRGPAIIAMGRNWDKKFLPQFVEVLRNDPVDGNRSYVAHFLGTKKVKEAIPALKNVAEKDAAPSVREVAQEALEVISK